MQFRRITDADRSEVFRFCVEGMRPELFPRLTLCPGKVNGAISHLVDSHVDFHLGAFEHDRMVGGVAALASPMLWFERHEATVVMFRATRPGVGKHLLAELLRWAKNEMRIRRLILPLEFDARPAMGRYLRACGFEAPQGLAVAYT